MTTRISMLAIDLAKGSFQVCAIGADGAVLYNRVLSRPRLMTLLSEQPTCVVAMEACATSTPAAPTVARPAAPVPRKVRPSASTSRAGGASSANEGSRIGNRSPHCHSGH